MHLLQCPILSLSPGSPATGLRRWGGYWRKGGTPRIPAFEIPGGCIRINTALPLSFQQFFVDPQRSAIEAHKVHHLDAALIRVRFYRIDRDARRPLRRKAI